jgi:pyrimidine operon attenuation protein/uracil phosphoribosyltransferase
VTTVDVDIGQLLGKIAAGLEALLHARRAHHVTMIGIHTGGVWIAQRLHRLLRLEEPLGTLDISFYRDDFTRAGINPQVKPSRLPSPIDDRHIILVDDVLYTGRTIRAALNEIFDYGRPATVALACLVERSGRELPIQADAFGVHLELAPGQQVKLQGPDPLSLVITDVGAQHAVHSRD